jgi:hypothetical protein
MYLHPKGYPNGKNARDWKGTPVVNLDQPSIKVLNAALDETPTGDIILRGVIDCTSLRHLGVDSYQREALDNTKVRQLQAAIAKGSTVPDIVLGMRGERILTREGVWYLQDDVYVIDGLQRMTAAIRVMQANTEAEPHLGAKIHFNTTVALEKEMFENLNLGQTKLSPNVTLRNYQDTIPAIAVLHKLSETKGFVLFGLVSWDQNMARGRMFSAMTYVKTVAMLHSHAGPGRGTNVTDVANGLDKIMANVGRQQFTANARVFFEIVDACWGIKRVTHRFGASYVKASFLRELARVFSDHTNFWDNGQLIVDVSTINKLRSFPIDDPEVMRLSSASSGPSGDMLNMLMVNHINSGRRTRRLVPRRGLRDVPFDLDEASGYNGSE